MDGSTSRGAGATNIKRSLPMTAQRATTVLRGTEHSFQEVSMPGPLVEPQLPLFRDNHAALELRD